MTTRPTKTKTQAPKPNYRSIRALYDETHITVYQAFSSEIATAAVQAQKLNASPTYSTDRTTWIKPSFTWMMYRSGYSYKDANQSNILALKMRHEDFAALLDGVVLAEDKHRRGEDVVVQWDPERSARIGRLGWRSIQIGIPGVVAVRWRDEWIVGIEDVTDVAKRLKERIDGDNKVGEETLIEEGLLPAERIYDDMVPEHIREKLKIGVEKETS